MNGHALLGALLGDPAHGRRRYLLVVGGVTYGGWLTGEMGALVHLLQTSVWPLALVGSLIGLFAGWDDQGLLGGYVGTMAYVVVVLVTRTQWTSTIVWSLPPLVQRAAVTVAVATAIVCLPGYFAGACARIVAARRGRSADQ